MARERITITIRNDLLQQVDRLVDGINVRSRSQAFEYLLSKVLLDYRLRKVIVLAGGKKKDTVLGKTPRFLVKINGKSLLEHVLDSIHEFNISNFMVYTDTFGNAIENEFAGKKLPYDVNFVSGEKPTGTVEPLLKAKSKLDDTFLVAYGDTITSINLNDMLAFHRKNKALATIALTTVSNPRNHGVVMMQGNKINEFIQKPKKDVHSYLVNVGYFLFEPEIFKHIGRNVKSLEQDLFPKLAKKGLLYGYAFQGKYINVHSKADLERARVML